MRERACDVAVIGAGTAGIAAVRAAREAGADAVLIERGPGGTTCARVGCMPSKLLIAAGAAAHAARHANLFGIHAASVAVDGVAVMRRVRAERDRFAGLVRDGLDDIPPGRRLAGEARFRDGHSLEIGGETILRFRTAVIATGSSPSVPALLRGLGARVLTTDTVFEIADLPASLAVLGAGPVGIELAQAMARLGVSVGVIDSGSTLAGLTHPDLVETAAAILGQELDLHRDATLTAAEADGDGVRLTWRAADGRCTEGRFARVLAATGRAPNLNLGLDRAGLRLDADGMPAFDRKTLLCEGALVLIAGDADALRPILHEASRQGSIAGANAVACLRGEPLRAPEPWTELAMVFTHPQTAAIGAAYDPDAAGRLIGSVDFCDQGRARIEGHNRGGARLWADRGGRLLGAELIGPAVEHLAHLLTYAVAEGQTCQALLDRPVYHPTVEEGLGQALSEIAHAVCNERAGTEP